MALDTQHRKATIGDVSIVYGDLLGDVFFRLRMRSNASQGGGAYSGIGHVT